EGPSRTHRRGRRGGCRRGAGARRREPDLGRGDGGASRAAAPGRRRALRRRRRTARPGDRPGAARRCRGAAGRTAHREGRRRPAPRGCGWGARVVGDAGARRWAGRRGRPAPGNGPVGGRGDRRRRRDVARAGRRRGSAGRRRGAARRPPQPLVARDGTALRARDGPRTGRPAADRGGPCAVGVEGPGPGRGSHGV
ncbi:MAG: Tryptophan-associated membrane protein, partial [uncultured Blastococcus sp.]